MQFIYRPEGVCSKKIIIELENMDQPVVRKVEFIGGCEGNLSGIAKLVIGLSADELIEKLAGIKCGRKKTSCPDQLALALKQAIAGQQIQLEQSDSL